MAAVLATIHMQIGSMWRAVATSLSISPSRNASASSACLGNHAMFISLLCVFSWTPTS